MTARFDLGSLALINPHGVPFGVETLAEGTDFGNPLPVEVAIRSLLQDGSIVVHEGDDNREIMLRVVIKASSSVGLADGDKALMGELYRRNTLTYTPVDGLGDPTVFDVITSSLAFTPQNDLGEVRGEHTWTVRLICEPFGHRATETTATPTPTSVGTARQQMHTVTVDGSARTRARLAVEHASASLGDVLLYTFPDAGVGESPPLRQYADATTASAATVDTTLVSGARNMLDTAAVFDVPPETKPDGLYLLVAKMRASAPGTATIAARVQTFIGATQVAGSDDPVASAAVAFSDGSPTAWRLATLGEVILRQADVGDQSTATLRVTIYDTDTTGIDVDLDEAWLLDITNGRVTQVSCGTGTAAAGGPSRRLFLEPPTIAYPRTRLLVGHTSDKSDAFYPGSSIAGFAVEHTLAPGDNKVWVVTTNATTAVTSLGWYDRFHTHVVSG